MDNKDFIKEFEELISKHEGISFLKDHYGITDYDIMRVFRDGVSGLVRKKIIMGKEKQNG